MSADLPGATIRVLLAEDLSLIREALSTLLDLEPGIEVVAEIAHGGDIVPTALGVRPDVAVLDIDLPGTSGIEAAAELRERLPACRVLVLTGLPQPGHYLQAMEVGVEGLLPKGSPAARLVEAIRTIAAGGRVLDGAMVAAARLTGHNPLTEREAQVLAAVAGGGSTEDVAKTLHLAPITVRNYLSRVIAKLDARNRTDAIRIAREAGWLA